MTNQILELQRKNADAVNDGSPFGRVYSRLLHLQIDLQQEDDMDGEVVLCDYALDPFEAALKRNNE